MLTYSRIKSVGVQKQGEDTRVVSGVLEDELYAMQCEISVHWPTLTVDSVQARMKRFTTSRCLEATKVFQTIQGHKLGPDLDAFIKKEIGRAGCRHMAGLMLECCQSLVRAEFATALRCATASKPDLDRKQYLDEYCSQHPELAHYMAIQ